MKNKNKEIIILFFSSIIFIIHFFTTKYNFFQWPEIDNFNFIRRFYDKDYLFEDFTVDSVSKKNPRNIFQFFIIGLSKILSLSWEKILFIIDLFSRLILPVLLYKNVLYFSKKINYNTDKNFVFISIILLICLSYYGISFFETMGYEFHIFGFQPTNFSLILISTGLIFHINKKKILKFFGIILIMLGTLVHPIIGLFYFLAYVLSNFELKKVKKIFIYTLITLIIPLLIILQFSENSELSTTDFNDTYIYLRHPHHFHISKILSDPINLFKVIFSILILLIPYLKFKSKKYLLIPCILILSIITQYFFIEVYPIKIFSILGLNRIFFFLPLLLIIQLSGLFKLNFKYRINYSKKIIIFPLIVFFSFTIFIKNPSNLNIKEDLGLSNFIEKIDEKDVIYVDSNFRISPEEINVVYQKRIFISSIFPFNENYFKEYARRFKLKKQIKELDNSIPLLKKEKIKYILTNKTINSNETELVYEYGLEKVYIIKY